MSKNLPVVQTIWQSVKFTFGNFGSLAKASLVWLVISALFNLMFEFLGVGEYLSKLNNLDMLNTRNAQYKDASVTTLAATQEVLTQLKFELELIRETLGGYIDFHSWGNLLINAVAYCSISVMWVRANLLAEKPPYIRFGSLEIKFLLYFLAFVAALFAIFMSVWFVVIGQETSNSSLGFIAVLVGFALILVASRFFLVFPGVAVGDKRMNPFSSWGYSKNNGWDMYGGTLLTAIVCIPTLVIKALVRDAGYAIYINEPIQLFLSILCISLMILYLSMAYKFLVPRPQDGDLN